MFTESVLYMCMYMYIYVHVRKCKCPMYIYIHVCVYLCSHCLIFVIAVLCSAVYSNSTCLVCSPAARVAAKTGCGWNLLHRDGGASDVFSSSLLPQDFQLLESGTCTCMIATVTLWLPYDTQGYVHVCPVHPIQESTCTHSRECTM